MMGANEDPATGSASGPLGCYLVKHGLVPAEKAGSIVSAQGVKMGRPSRIHIKIDQAGGEISRVRVGGTSVLVGEGRLASVIDQGHRRHRRHRTAKRHVLSKSEPSAPSVALVWF